MKKLFLVLSMTLLAETKAPVVPVAPPAVDPKVEATFWRLQMIIQQRSKEIQDLSKQSLELEEKMKNGCGSKHSLKSTDNGLACIANAPDPVQAKK